MFLTQSGRLSYVIKRPDVWNNDRLVTGAKWMRVFRSPYDTRSCSFRNPQKSFSRGRGCWRMGLMLDLITVVIKLSGSHKSVPGRVCRNLVGVSLSLSVSDRPLCQARHPQLCPSGPWIQKAVQLSILQFCASSKPLTWSSAGPGIHHVVRHRSAWIHISARHVISKERCL